MLVCNGVNGVCIRSGKVAAKRVNDFSDTALLSLVDFAKFSLGDSDPINRRPFSVIFLFCFETKRVWQILFFVFNYKVGSHGLTMIYYVNCRNYYGLEIGQYFELQV